MSEHAELSPSSAVRWMVCPGSVALNRGQSDEGSSYADEGTDAHELAAVCLNEGTDAFKYLSLEMGKGNVVDADMARNIQQYVDYVREIAKDGELMVEQRLSISEITGEADAFGTADAIVIVGDTLHVIDLKFGRGDPVEAENNPQLQIYALAALSTFGVLYDIKSVVMHIHQPRLFAVSSWSQTVDELTLFGDKVWNAAIDTRQPNAPLVTSPKGCKWCKAKADCTALRDEVVATFNSIQPNEATEYDLAWCMERADLIESWISAIRAKVMANLKQGVAVPGFKLVQGKRGARAWSSPADAEALLKACRVKHDQMYDYKVISPTKAEALFKEKIIGPRQWPKVQALITQSEGNPSVAPVSDKRPALVLDVTDDFETLV